MKKYTIITSLLILFVCSMNCMWAQTAKGTNELKIGYGIATTNDIINITSEAVIYTLTLGNSTFLEKNSYGAVFISYKRAIANNLLLGVAFTYQNSDGDVITGRSKIGDFEEEYYTIALESDYHYISKDIFKMYSGLGIGYTIRNEDFRATDANFSNESMNSNHFNFQITGIGVRVGKALSGYAEAGFGYRGVLNLGVSYQF
ncbi:hypothetical protein [Aquimarina sp. RZ0]|uniref:hypothetical protein n=1 Tax=Aquimarina sp. RZ0 TaxID=2607730 RepID=UPI0011F1ED9E|nr:hypothetical protein [Aquimarina sp. RZ0]KAA1244994.1 hypothetical protein F0000_14050 [Aquimarina sp. RZ0]